MPNSNARSMACQAAMLVACAASLPESATAGSVTQGTSDVQVVHRFKNKDRGVQPGGALLRASDGALYGATAGGGPGDFGTLFRIAPDGTFTNFATFDIDDGISPVGDLVQATDGKLYGVTTEGGPFDRGVIFRIALDGTRELLYSFTDGYGGNPASGLTLGVDGNFYGVVSGGTRNRTDVYRVSTDGTFSWFAESRQSNCNTARSRLAAAPDGSLYGVGSRCLFEVGSNAAFDVLYRFHYDDALGVLRGSDGDLYVTTRVLRQFKHARKACGRLYHITPEGQAQVLHSWPCRSNGQYLAPGLVQGPDGALHGAFERVGFGMLFFKLGLDGSYWQEHVAVHKGDGVQALMRDSDGYYYAAAQNGGVDNHGAILRTLGGD